MEQESSEENKKHQHTSFKDIKTNTIVCIYVIEFNFVIRLR